MFKSLVMPASLALPILTRSKKEQRYKRPRNGMIRRSSFHMTAFNSSAVGGTNSLSPRPIDSSSYSITCGFSVNCCSFSYFSDILRLGKRGKKRALKWLISVAPAPSPPLFISTHHSLVTSKLQPIARFIFHLHTHFPLIGCHVSQYLHIFKLFFLDLVLPRRTGEYFAFTNLGCMAK